MDLGYAKLENFWLINGKSQVSIHNKQLIQKLFKPVWAHNLCIWVMLNQKTLKYESFKIFWMHRDVFGIKTFTETSGLGP